ncbi:MAG: hypothetical protein IJ650_01980 [Paludibacteraceae bacterium]|nr:hypothetical protein [Paludibacteraceae bacterium]
MFKYTKRLICNIRYYWREIQLRAKEERKLAEAEDKWGEEHPLAGFGCYQNIQYARNMRRKQHEQEIAQIK